MFQNCSNKSKTLKITLKGVNFYPKAWSFFKVDPNYYYLGWPKYTEKTTKKGIQSNITKQGWIGYGKITPYAMHYG